MSSLETCVWPYVIDKSGKTMEDLKTVRPLEHLLLLPKISTENSGTI